MLTIFRKVIHRLIAVVYAVSLSAIASGQVLVGAYYFDGWAGQNENCKHSEWFRKINAPVSMTDKLYLKFPEREPIWGWRDDDIKIMESQIDLAADNGIDFFTFCWYFSDNKGRINEEAIAANPMHTSIELFMQAKNKHKMKFAILIANHNGAEITTQEDWIATIDYMTEHYFNDAQYLKIDGKPVLDFFVSAESHKYINEIRHEVKSKGFPDLCYFSNGKFYVDADINGWYNIREKEDGTSEGRPYEQLTSYVESCWWKTKDWNVVPVVMVGWDKRPWEATEKTKYYINRTPAKFKNHFRNAMLNVQSNNPSIKIVMIYAWNELGEGGYLVPTKGDPKGKYLKAIKEARRELGY